MRVLCPSCGSVATIATLDIRKHLRLLALSASSAKRDYNKPSFITSYVKKEMDFPYHLKVSVIQR